ncbi:MAG TPA: hypothetical protein VFX06_09125 [Stellaceae bacterium]|nr:hypothetical protein [Stellaceae bacterium]
MSHRIAAVVVLYHPDKAAQEGLLCRLLHPISADVECVYLFLNSPPAAELIAQCRAAAGTTPVEILGTGDNVGLGYAYNEAARAAGQRGCDLLLIFDQDSEPAPGLPRRLAAAYDEAGGRAARIAVIGPRPTAPTGNVPYKLPPATLRSGPGSLVEVGFVISSGSLIDLAALTDIGPFRADFFIDGIDIEWGFRARARGFRCLRVDTEAMPHRVGRGVRRPGPLPVRFVEQSAPRLFTYARNQVAMMRLPHVPLSWKARTALSLGLRLMLSLGSRARQREAGAIVRGIRCGLRGELGRPPTMAEEPVR